MQLAFDREFSGLCRIGSVHLSKCPAARLSRACSSLRSCARRRKGSQVSVQSVAHNAGGSEEGLSNQAEQILKLEKLLRLSDPPPEPSVAVCGRIHNLPLWRIQQTILPGMQVIMAGPKPWRFGYLLLPEGSVNLGNPTYGLRPHTKAPLVGTLAEILHCDHLPDGRMNMLVAGLARFKVVEERQQLPYSRADVELWADEEEVVLMRAAALKALDAAAQGGQIMSTWHMSSGVANAAASAAAQAWVEWEMGELRGSLEEEIEARRQEGLPRSSSTSDSLVWRGAVPRSLGTRAGSSAGPLRTGPEELLPLRAPRINGSSPGDQGIILETVAAAHAGAASAADTAVASSKDQQERPLDLPRLPVINSCIDRGVLVPGVSESAESEINEQLRSIVWTSGEETWAEVVGLEALMWRTLDVVQKLRMRVKPSVPALPQGLLMLRPATTIRPSENLTGEGMSGSTPEAAASPVAPDGLLEKREPEANCCEPADDAIEQLMLGCKYSSLRRAQRLSFAVGAVLDGVSGSEGRQALLEMSSVRQRLRWEIGWLLEERNRLQLVLALVRMYDSDGGKDIPVD